MRASRRARARTIDRLALAEVGIVRRAEDAAAEAAQQALEVAVVNVAKQHLRAEVGMHLVSDGRVKLLLVAMLRGQREPCMFTLRNTFTFTFISKNVNQNFFPAS